jgi:hypothetical protein
MKKRRTMLRAAGDALCQFSAMWKPKDFLIKSDTKTTIASNAIRVYASISIHGLHRG